MGIKIEGFPGGTMEPLVQEAVVQPGKIQPEGLNWAKDPAVKQLLDVLASILAEEYVQTVKRHPGEFSRNGDVV